MPYVEDFSGIYVIRNSVTGNGYVGQSARMRKRIADHFNLLRRGTHPNQHLQNSFSKYGEGAFSYDFEVVCDDPAELTALEEAYLSGGAKFDDTPVYYNISKTAHTPMRGRSHTAETKAKIARSKEGRTEHVTPAYRALLASAQRARHLADPDFVSRVKYIVSNPHLSYAERGRHVGLDTSAARRLALKYANDKEFLNG
jgi:group I intron endonuclease